MLPIAFGSSAIHRRLAAAFTYAAIAAAALWLTLPASRGIAGDEAIERVEAVFASADAFAACLRDGAIDVTTAPSGVVLASSECLVHEVGNHVAKETLAAARTARVRFDLGTSAARRAEVFVFGRPATGRWNGGDVAFRHLDGIGWSVVEVEGPRLRAGTNTLEFPSGTLLSFDTDSTPSRHSSTSDDGGRTWQPAAGEYLVRLRLHRHPARGVITAAVTDMANPDGEYRICPLVAVKSLAVTAEADTPAGTAVILEARSGPAPQPDASWTTWLPAAEVRPHRFVQWRATLTTADPALTPTLGRVALAGDVAILAEPARQGLALREFRNQRIVRGSHPFAWQPPSEKLARLRETWKLDEVIAAGQTDLERFILLRNWVRRQWPHNEGACGRPWDALDILSAPPGDHGMCVHYGVVFTQCALALGFNARQLILRNHYVADVWSNDHVKWILMDVEAVQKEGWDRHGTAVYWDRDRDEPMSALDIHRVAVVEKRPEGIIQKLAMTDGRGGHDAVDRMLPAADYRNFECLAALVRNDYLDRPEPWERQHGVDYYHSDEYLWWQGGAAPIAGQYSRHTSREGDFLWTVNQAAIALTATDSADRLDVSLDTVTPNFREFLCRIDGGDWRALPMGDGPQAAGSCQASLPWTLHAGENTLDVKPRNAFDRDGIVSRVVVTGSEPLSAGEAKRRALNDACDRSNLRKRAEFVVDTTDAFLRVPERLATDASFDRATVPPTCRLQICPGLVPEHFGQSQQYMACWANWASVGRTDDDRFLMAASNHLAVGCDINVYVYERGAKAIRTLIDVDELLGWKKNQFTDGKIHGHMAATSDGTLWAATHFGVKPDAAWYAAGYTGAWLFSYDLATGTGRTWGHPLPGNSLSCFTVDTKRGRFIGTGEMGGFLHWDCIAKEVKYAAPPPNGWRWAPRSMLLDPETGILWGQEQSAEPARFISFDPARNRFHRHETPTPTPAGAASSLLRGHTDRPAQDGFFYWATQAGQFFRFKPRGHEEPVVQLLDAATWEDGRDTLQMALSPKGRYVYYFAKGDPTPVVQYDVATGRRKAVCWLQDHYFEKYGYFMGECYGINISADGSFLVACVNGTFTNKRSSAFGHPACLVIEIPAAERPE